jgi:GAF domain/Pyridoxamine 5'-phosphate oxidase
MTEVALSVPLEEIQDCFQGVVPSPVCSVDADGKPNVTYLSIVHYLDERHVGLSRQFFNKTAANVRINPRVQVLVVHPDDGRQFRLGLSYEHTVVEGSLFERVRTQLDAVASQTGMSKVFKLAGVDICEVLNCDQVPSDADSQPQPVPVVDLLTLDAFSDRIASAGSIDELITNSLDALVDVIGYEHVILLMPDEAHGRLYTLASRGYPQSGAGSEVRFGEGIIGVAAQRREVVGLASMGADRIYTKAIRSEVEKAGGADDLEHEIEVPGLPNVLSQIVVPVIARDQLLAVLCLQSETAGRFRAADENVLKIAARQIGLSMALLGPAATLEPAITAQIEEPPPGRSSEAVPIKHYCADDSIFIGGDYLVKGLAGAVLWRLLRIYEQENRVDFTNREVRLDSSLDLPHFKDNLETRLILLRRRLADRCHPLRIENTGRGRFRLVVERPIALQEVAT